MQARNDSTRCYLHSEVLCIFRALYSSACELQPSELPASGGARQYVTFRRIHQPLHTVLLYTPGIDSQRQSSCHIESARNMTSSANRRIGFISMLSIDAHSCTAWVSIYLLSRVGLAGPTCDAPRLILASFLFRHLLYARRVLGWCVRHYLLTILERLLRIAHQCKPVEPVIRRHPIQYSNPILRLIRRPMHLR